MAAYELTQNSNFVIRESDGVYIPNDPHNNDWIAYQAWLAKGNIPDAYVAPIPSPQQQFNTQISYGVNTQWTISNGPDGSLNGLYAIDPTTLSNITGESVVILLSGKFSTGSTTRYWLSMNGTPMPMNIPQFQAFALAVSGYVDSLYAVQAALLGGQNVSWPNNTITIDA
jgi:hypothetical protein